MRVAPEIRLNDEERKILREMIRKGESPARKQTRARILLLADEVRRRSGGEQIRKSNSNQTIGERLEVCARTVSRVRQRYIQGGLNAALEDSPRQGRPVEIDGETEAHLIALACSNPPEGRNVWTMQLLADRLVELGYVEKVSETWVRKRLKKTNCDRGKLKVGVSQK